MLIPNNTTVAVVDGENFHIYRNEGTLQAIKLAELPTPETHDRHANNGRLNSSGNPAEKQQEEDAFGKGVAEKLNRMVLDGRIEQVVIVASPRSLGEMRRNYHPKLDEVLLKEVNKTLTNANLAEIEAAITAE